MAKTQEEQKGMISRRKFLGVAAGGVVAGLVIGGVAGYFSGQAGVAPTTITQTKTATITRTETTTASTTGVPPRTIKIGTTVSESGPLASMVSITDKMLHTWADMINERGGLYVKEYKQGLPIEMIVYDDKGDIPTCNKYFEKLSTDDKVDLLIGSFSPLSYGASAIAEKYSIPYIDTAAAYRVIFNRGFKWIVGSLATMDRWTWRYLEMLAAEGKVKTLGVVYAEDPWGKEVSEGLQAKAKELGLQVVHSESHSGTTMDFTSIISKLRTLDPDAVVMVSAPPSDITFLKQVGESGWKYREFHAVNAINEFFPQAVGPELANYTTGEIYWSPELPYSGVWGKEFWLELVNRSGFSYWSYPWEVVWYVGLEIASAGIEISGSLDKAKINDALHTMNIMTIIGPWHTQSYGDVSGVGLANAFPAQRQGDKIAVLWPPEVKTGDHIYPRP